MFRVYLDLADQDVFYDQDGWQADTYQVFDIFSNDEEINFLIFHDGKWKYVDSSQCKPLEY